MLLRLPNVPARLATVFVALMLGSTFACLSIRSARADCYNTDVQGAERSSFIEVPWTSGRDIHYVRVCVVRDTSGKLDSLIHGSAWVDDVALIPDATGNPRP